MFLLPLLFALQSDTVHYDVRFPNAVHHEAEIAVTFPAGGRDTLTVWMSRSSPGRYALHEFAKNVYSVRAERADGRPVAVERADAYRWRVPTGGGSVTVRYTLFGNRADGTYSAIDPSHAHLNMPATFAWAEGFDRAPVSVAFAPPAGSNWKVATQLLPTLDPMRFAAPDLQYFMDSPTELSDFRVITWTVRSGDGRVDTMRLALHHQGTDAEADSFAGMVRQVVAEEVALFGETARYDAGTYTFIADYLPWASGDGMEHRNSTILSSSSSLARNSMGLLGTVSHEFFHSWNMERIRAQAIEPFDFTRANSSDGLWFGEGFTSYFDDLFIRRAGLTTDSAYAANLGGLVSTVISDPARQYHSPMEMSQLAPFVDAATSVDPTNLGNTFLSYYTWGAAIGLGLDLTIRQRFAGKTLDGFMRLMWMRHGRNTAPFTILDPYTVDDLELALGDYTGSRQFARDFFANYVRGRDVVDYTPLLAQAGMLLRRRNPSASFLGFVQLDIDSTGALVRAPTPPGSPLYAAGVESGDRIITIAGTPITSDEAWTEIEAAHRTGEVSPLVLERHGARTTTEVTFASDPRLELVLFESVGQQPTATELKFRRDWFGSRAAGGSR